MANFQNLQRGGDFFPPPSNKNPAGRAADAFAVTQYAAPAFGDVCTYCNAAAEDVLCDWGHPDCGVARERAPCLPSGATRSCVHISSRAVTHSRGERVLSWGQHLCSPAKKARPTLGGQAAVQHSGALCRIRTRARRRRARRSAGGIGRWAGEGFRQNAWIHLIKKRRRKNVGVSQVCFQETDQRVTINYIDVELASASLQKYQKTVANSCSSWHLT